MKKIPLLSPLISFVFIAAACSSESYSTAPVEDAGRGDGGTPSVDGSTADGGPAAACNDGVKNGGEADLDCGGTCTAKCAVGKACATGADCATGACGASKTCVGAAVCNDGVKNGTEADVDCGGSCGPCAAGKSCGISADCASGTCANGSCAAAASCNDGVKNNTEADVDCGGACAACTVGRACRTGNDCATANCGPNSTCVAAAACNDSIKNGAESDVDCGGACAACAVGRACRTAGDCATAICGPNNTCVAMANCNDGIKNGTEADVDCGGACAAKCAVGKACGAPGDCASGLCTNGACVAPLCNIDAITWVAPQNKYLVAAKGKAWSIDGAGNLLGAEVDIRAMPGMANGPCAGQAGDCRLDALTLDSKRGYYFAFWGTRVWAFDGNGTPLVNNLYADVAGLAAGPCAAQPAGACRIEGAMYQADQDVINVTVGDKFWGLNAANYQLSGPAAGQSITVAPGGVAVCNGLGAGCVSSDVNWRNDTKETEFYGNGRRWVLDANLQLKPGTGELLTSIAGFAQGPCR